MGRIKWILPVGHHSQAEIAGFSNRVKGEAFLFVLGS